MMRTRTLAALPLCLLIAGSLLACRTEGGDPSAIHTATPPDPLPTPRLFVFGRPPIAGNTYTVQPGDSLSSIADQFGVTVEELMAANGIDDPTQLVEGEVLVIPAAPQPGAGPPATGAEGEATPEAADTPIPTPTPGAEGEQTFVVQDGDIAAVIAEQNGITIEELAAANNATVDDLRELTVGDVLVIPTPSAE